MSQARIRLKNGARELELEGDRLLIEELLARYAPWVQAGAHGAGAHGAGIQGIESAGDAFQDLPRVPSAFRVETKVALVDFLALKAPASPLDRLLVIAYYLEKYQQCPEYPPGRLAATWQECWPKETLDSQLWEEGVAQGYLEWQQPETLTLTYRGQIHVRDGLTSL